jgi:hypothetical protein
MPDKSRFWKVTQPRFIKCRPPPILCVAAGRVQSGEQQGQERSGVERNSLQTFIGHNESELVVLSIICYSRLEEISFDEGGGDNQQHANGRYVNDASE